MAPPQQDKVRYTREDLWRIYTEIGLSERHFNTVQEKFRLLASTWLLATVAAGAYLFVNEGNFVPLSASCIAAALAYLGSVGIALLWILDIKVYQALLSSYYAEGLILEEAQDWLPQIRSRIRTRFRGRVQFLISTYYIGSTSFLLVLGSGALGVFVLRTEQMNPWEPQFLLAVLLGVLSLATVLAMLAFSPQPRRVLENEADDARMRHYREAVIGE